MARPPAIRSRTSRRATWRGPLMISFTPPSPMPRSGCEPGLADPGVFLHQAQQGPGFAPAERMPDLGLAPFAVRHAHGPVPVGHLTVRYPLGDRTVTACSARVNATTIRAAREMIMMDGF